MGPLLIVAFGPEIKIVLQLLDRGIELFSEDDAVELVEDCLVEALTNSVRLRALGLGPGMIDILQREIELIFVMPGIAAKGLFRSVRFDQHLVCDGLSGKGDGEK